MAKDNVEPIEENVEPQEVEKSQEVEKPQEEVPQEVEQPEKVEQPKEVEKPKGPVSLKVDGACSHCGKPQKVLISFCDEDCKQAFVNSK